MDFELSKENILPLAGGRNVQQLGMALQAQTNRESQMELQQQREQWEALIKSYTGDDPLDNYYKYITWIEQTFPKQGHEGNVISLLEHCLKLFENDKRYINDRRFCKLWIKYFDFLPNPLELYQMMKAKGLCAGCADFYKAWAYYHEAAGDFQAANNVLEEGKKNFAQPYEELENAHSNLIMAAGQHLIFGPDESQLMEKRQALTSLHTYRSGRVSSIRVPSNDGLVTVPASTSGSSRPNSTVRVHEDWSGEAAASFQKAPPVSLITAAKRQELPKENTLKAGPWTATVPVKKRVITTPGGNIAAGFTVHEDVMEPTQSIRLPKNYPKSTLESYSDWAVAVSHPDPPNPNERPMYPKHHVYSQPNTEYCIEEIKAQRYKSRASQQQQPITIDDDEVEFVPQPAAIIQPNSDQIHRPINQDQYFSPQRSQQNVLQSTSSPYSSLQKDKRIQMQKQSPTPRQPKTPPKLKPSSLQYRPTPMQTQQSSMQRPISSVKPQLALAQALPIQTQHHVSPVQTQYQLSPMQTQVSPMQTQQSVSPMQTQYSPLLNQLSPNETLKKGNALTTNWNAGSSFDLWQSPQEVAVVGTAFHIFDQSLDQIQPKGSAMKTAVKDLNADELAETGSRGGMDVAVTAQAGDSAKPFELADDTLNTHLFNLNAMQVSTPQNKRSAFNTISPDEEEQLTLTKKQLFSEPLPVKGLSTIYEERSNSTNSGSSASAPTLLSEEHNNYLAQNLRANAELRSSLLGDLMDFNTAKPAEVRDEYQASAHTSTYDISVRVIPEPASVMPLEFVPSDPFKSHLINKLLDKVAFPGPHTCGYLEIPSIPRLCVKKEPSYIGRDRYIIERQLGKGTFGTVYKAVDLETCGTVAMKYQKPPNKWEFYICREIQSRLSKHPLRDRFMDIPLAYFCDQASLIISEFMPGGSLLDVANMHKQKVGKTMKECMVIYFCIQMLQIVQAMHEVKIIHADIKPDNFLVFITPDNTVGLQLIDFGCSIDMSLFPANATFRRRVTTENFVCCEMLDGRPWNYHTDMFCIAATAHVLLFDTYIKLQKKDNLWSIQQRFPRYLKVDLWNMFFSDLLNQQTAPANSATLIVLLEETLEILNRDSSSALPSQMRYIVNFLKNR